MINTHLILHRSELQAQEKSCCGIGRFLSNQMSFMFHESFDLARVIKFHKAVAAGIISKQLFQEFEKVVWAPQSRRSHYNNAGGDCRNTVNSPLQSGLATPSTSILSVLLSSSVSHVAALLPSTQSCLASSDRFHQTCWNRPMTYSKTGPEVPF